MPSYLVYIRIEADRSIIRRKVTADNLLDAADTVENTMLAEGQKLIKIEECE